MKRFLLVLSSTAALVAAILVFSPVTYAASPAVECELAGGEYVAAGPDSTCTIPGEDVGNSDNKKGGSTTTGPGNSPKKETDTCDGVDNKPHCP